MTLLWKPENWPLRLAELEARTGDIKEAPLRRDVRSLGMLLGQVLREQAGERSSAEVEELRQIAIRRREAQRGTRPGSPSLRPWAASARWTRCRPIAWRGPSLFISSSSTWPRPTTANAGGSRCSFPVRHSAVPCGERCAPCGLQASPAKQAVDWLRHISIIPVFTAHPTEVARRVVMFKRRRIADLLEQLDRIPLSDEQLELSEESLTAEITALWETDEVRTRRPTVRDEVKMGLDYYDASIYATLPGLYAEVAAAFEAEYGVCLSLAEMPVLLSFGSWIGGDRDGNPYVTPQVTREALQMAREHLLAHYQQELGLSSICSPVRRSRRRSAARSSSGCKIISMHSIPPGRRPSESASSMNRTGDS